MKIQSFSFYAFLFTILLVSCKKEDGGSKDTNNKLQLASLEVNNQGAVEKEIFNYNTANLITRIISETWKLPQDSTYRQPFYNMDFQWNLDNTLSRVTNTMSVSQSSYSLQFTKDPGHQLVRKGFFPINIMYPDQSWLGFDSKGRVVADSTGFSSYKIYTWNANDDIVKTDNYVKNSSGGYTNNYSTEYTYDDKKNPLFSFTPFFFLRDLGSNYSYQCNHNLLEEKITLNGSNPTVVVSYSYEYNEQGYPTKRTTLNTTTMYGSYIKYTYK